MINLRVIKKSISVLMGNLFLRVGAVCMKANNYLGVLRSETLWIL